MIRSNGSERIESYSCIGVTPLAASSALPNRAEAVTNCDSTKLGVSVGLAVPANGHTFYRATVDGLLALRSNAGAIGVVSPPFAAATQVLELTNEDRILVGVETSTLNVNAYTLGADGATFTRVGRQLGGGKVLLATSTFSCAP